MKKKQKMKIKTDQVVLLDETSSLNNHYLCHLCKKKYKLKGALIKHVQYCIGDNKIQNLTCDWCNLKFTNKGNLMQHYKLHGDTRYMQGNHLKRFQCSACHKLFAEGYLVKIHQRKHHYNYSYHTAVYTLKNIDDTWFEQVSNSNLLVRIKKLGHGTLLMKSSNPDIITELPEDTVELSCMPSTKKASHTFVPCKICGRHYAKKSLNKHLKEIHHNIRRHKCPNCKVTFKRSYQYIRHVCGKVRMRRSAIQKEENMRVGGAESLPKFD